VALRRRLSPGLPLSHTSEEASDLAVQYFEAFTDSGEAVIPYSWATIVQMNCHCHASCCSIARASSVFGRLPVGREYRATISAKRKLIATISYSGRS